MVHFIDNHENFEMIEGYGIYLPILYWDEPKLKLNCFLNLLINNHSMLYVFEAFDREVPRIMTKFSNPVYLSKIIEDEDVNQKVMEITAKYLMEHKILYSEG